MDVLTHHCRATVAQHINKHITDIIRDPSRRFDRSPHRLGASAEVISAAAVLAHCDAEGIYISVDLDVPAAYIIVRDTDGHEHDLARLPIVVADPVWY